MSRRGERARTKKYTKLGNRIVQKAFPIPGLMMRMDSMLELAQVLKHQKPIAIAIPIGQGPGVGIRNPQSASLPGEAIFLHLLPECLAVDTEILGGPGLVALKLLERVEDLVHLDSGEAAAGRIARTG